jgi:hypothetical protein
VPRSRICPDLEIPSVAVGRAVELEQTEFRWPWRCQAPFTYGSIASHAQSPRKPIRHKGDREGRRRRVHRGPGQGRQRTFCKHKRWIASIRRQGEVIRYAFFPILLRRHCGFMLVWWSARKYGEKIEPLGMPRTRPSVASRKCRFGFVWKQ